MARPWEFVIDFDREARLPPFLQIARRLADEIRRGRLRPNDRLPGSRRLASTLRVHRNTILAAYDELIAEGWLQTARGRGTFVANAIPEAAAAPIRGTRAGTAPANTAFALLDTPEPYRPPVLAAGTLSLSSGSPDIRLVPAALLGRAYRRVLATRASDVLSYGEPEGHPALRNALASMLTATRALSVSSREVFVARGSQMALSLVARALVGPGDVVAVEEWGYRPAWEAFRAAGATLMPVAVDAEGIDVTALGRLAEQSPVRAVYVTPHHQYPTTVTLEAGRRLDLLAIARDRKIAIVEDDYDHEFHYDGRPILPLASADRAGVVVYVGTLSKILAPGVRVGYVVAPSPLVSRLAALRSLLDIQGDLPTEAAVASLIEEGELQRHVARVRREYRHRRDVLADALMHALGTDVEFRVPPGGMAIWVKFPRVDVEQWAQRSLARGVAWYPGRRYAFGQTSRPFARFNFAHLNERELADAVKRLAAARP